MDDFLKDLKFNVYDRLRSPLLTSFAFSWVSWNFSTILLMFGRGDFDKKIYMLGRIYGNNWSYILNGLIFPLGTAAMFIVIYPHFARWAFIYWSAQFKITKKDQIKIEDETPVTQEDYKILKRNFYDISKAQDSEIDRLQGINKILKDAEKSMAAELGRLIENEASQNQELNDIKKEVTALKVDLDNKNNVITDQQNKIKEYETQTLESLKGNIDKKIVEYSLDKLITELGWKKGDVNQTLRVHLETIKQFKESNNLDIDELKIIIYLIGNEGRLDLEGLKNLLQLTNLNFEVVKNKLLGSQLCATNGREIYLTEHGKRRVYDANVSKISIKDLDNIIARLRSS